MEYYGDPRADVPYRTYFRYLSDEHDWAEMLPTDMQLKRARTGNYAESEEEREQRGKEGA